MAVAFALLTSLAYGLSNYIGPRLARGAPLFVLLVVGQTCSLVLAAVVVAAQGDPFPGGRGLGCALLAGLGNAGGLVLLYRAAAIGPLSVIMPIGALGAAVPVVVGVAGGDGLTVLKAAGIMLALAGVVLVTRQPLGAPATSEAAAVPAPASAGAGAGADRAGAIVLAAASAACFGVVLAAMGPASDDGAGWAVLLSRVSLLVVLVTLAVRVGALRGVRAGALPKLAVPGLLLFAGTLAYATATQKGDLSVVSVLSSLFPVVTVALALGLDRERVSGLQALGIAGTIAGVVLLSAR